MTVDAAPADDFTHRTLVHTKKRVHRLGLALNYGIDAAGFDAAVDLGVNYVLYTPMRTGAVLPSLRAALKRDRERFVVAGGPSLGFFGGSVERGVDSVLRKLQTDYLDVCQLFWVGVGSSWREATAEALVRLKEKGKIVAAGISIHDRPRAAKLALEPRLDLLMLRYNAAHPGAEREIFPTFAERRPDCVAYTATSWRKLLSAPKGWEGRVPDAGDCYRFALSSPHVDVVLTGPASRAQFEANLAALGRGPLSADEQAWMREFGAKVHG